MVRHNDPYMHEPIRKPPEPIGPFCHAGGAIDESCVSIRFFGDDLDPEEITRKLGAEPTSVCRKGDIRRGKRSDYVERTGKWLIGTESSAEPLEVQLNRLLDRLTSDLDIWKELVSKFDADIFCGIYLSEWNRGFCLPPLLSRRIADRQLQIGFDIYVAEGPVRWSDRVGPKAPG